VFQVDDARLVDGDMVMVFKVDASGMMIPLHCHDALIGVSSHLTTSVVAASVKEVFNRALGPSASDLPKLREAVWAGFSKKALCDTPTNLLTCTSPHPLPLYAVQICGRKKRRGVIASLDGYKFPVPFPSPELFRKYRGRWTTKDIIDIALWLDACGTKNKIAYLPAPTVAWAKSKHVVAEVQVGAVVPVAGAVDAAPAIAAQAALVEGELQAGV
jgi:hypothetical protein